MGCVNYLKVLLVAGAMSALAQGQTLQFQIQGGLCELADSNWRKPTQVSAPLREWPSTGEFLGLSGQSTAWDFGVERALNPRHGVRLLYHRASEGSGAFANRQWALDWVWHLVRRCERTFYTVGGFTLNQVEGTYEFHSGLLPPDGPGDYRVIAQSGRPGIKVGTGFQWSRHWAVEGAFHYITLNMSGAQAARDRATSYGAILLSCRFGGA
jgi:hypothetical protein